LKKARAAASSAWAAYLERGKKGHGSLVKTWNLIVPVAVQSRIWQEVA
jgi:hypothetical protein